MYIYKMTFIEKYDITEVGYDFLLEKRLLARTDYGTEEIIFDDDIIDNLTNSDKSKLSNYIGREIFKKLLSKELDFVLVV